MPQTASTPAAVQPIHHRTPGGGASDCPIPSSPAALAPNAGKARRAAAELLPELYDELCRLAASRLRRARLATVLSSAELVHEAYLRLAHRRGGFDDCRHFFFAAARAMRDVVVETLRRNDSLKRGGDVVTVSLDGHEIGAASPLRTLDLERALAKLAGERPQHARVLHLSYFAGLTHLEIAHTMGISRATVERRSTAARTWLRRELGAESCPRGVAPSAAKN